MGVIASSPWIGLSLLGLVYVSLIPFSWLAYRRQAVQDRGGRAATSSTCAPSIRARRRASDRKRRCSIRSCGDGSIRRSIAPAPGLPTRMSANAATLAGLAIGLLAVPLLAGGHYGGAVVILLNRLIDGLDGAIARQGGPRRSAAISTSCATWSSTPPCRWASPWPARAMRCGRRCCWRRSCARQRRSWAAR